MNRGYRLLAKKSMGYCEVENSVKMLIKVVCVIFVCRCGISPAIKLFRYLFELLVFVGVGLLLISSSLDF